MQNYNPSVMDYLIVIFFVGFVCWLYYKFKYKPNKDSLLIKEGNYIELFSGEVLYVLEVLDFENSKFLKVKDYENNSKIIAIRTVYKLVKQDVFNH